TVGTPITLNASWPGNYVWSTTATSSSINLTPSSRGSVNYSVDDNFSCMTDNFTVVSAASVPVKLIDFDVKENKSGVSISWVTTEESRNRQFNIHKSADGINFSFLATVPAKESPQQKNYYNTQDVNPFTAINYYRLIHEDVDGRQEILGTKKISIRSSDEFSMSIHSSADKQLAIRIVSANECDINARVLTQDGKVVCKKQYHKVKGVVSEQFNLLPGIYFCEIRNQRGVKIVKQAMVY